MRCVIITTLLTLRIIIVDFMSRARSERAVRAAHHINMMCMMFYCHRSLNLNQNFVVQ